MFKDNGEVIHFSNPKVQASLGSNTFAISGPSDTKCNKKILSKSDYDIFVLALQEMLPTIMSQMGMAPDGSLSTEAGRRKFAGRDDQQQSGATNDQVGAEADDEEVPGM